MDSKKYFLPILSGLFLFASCNKEEPKEEFDRQAMLNNMASAVIEPAASDLTTKLDDLNSKTTTFTASPTSANLNELKASYLEANKSFQRFKIFDIGPFMTYGIKNGMNTYPTDTSKIEANITSGSYVLGGADNSSAIGFPSMDYLLFHDSEAEIINGFSTDGNSTNRKNYLNEVVAKMKDEFALANGDWSSYKTGFLASTGNDATSSTNTLFNEYAKDMELIKNAKVAIPAGNQTGGETLPSYVEGYYGQHSLLFAQENTNGLLNFFKGGDGIGFDDYIIDVQDEEGTLANDIITQYADITAKISALSGPLSSDVDNNANGVQELYDELKVLVTYTKTDMSSALGLLITFSDNDGD
jgi:hypothetical protein